MTQITRRNALKTIGASAAATGLATQAMANTIAPAPQHLCCYSHRYTYYPGEVVELRYNIERADVNMSQPYTFGWTLKNVANDAVVASGTATLNARYPIQKPDVDQQWPITLTVTLPDNIEPGVYSFSPGGHPKTNARIASGLPIFVRRRINQNTPKPELLVVIPTNTSNAYSNFGGASTYGFNSPNGITTKPSFRRPMTIDGRADSELALMIKWIAQRYDADYVTDFEMHMEPDLLTGYKCVVLTMHNEYYTWDMYNSLKRYRDNGGNIVNAAGNSIWFLVTFADNNTAMLAKTGNNFYFWNQGRSSRFILGNHFEHVGLLPTNGPETATVYNDHHWMYDGTGLRTGDDFGRTEGVASYEMDGVPLQFITSTQPIVKPNSGIDPSYVCLAVSLCTKTYPNNTKARPMQNWTVGVFDVPGGGQVFNPATINWAKAFNAAAGPIPKMTGNFLRAVTNTQLIEFRSPNPVRPRGNSMAENGYMYIYLKRSELNGLPQRRIDGRLIISRDGFEWTETHTRLTLPTAQRVSVVPVYKHKTMLMVPGTKIRMPKEILSTSATAVQGWTVSGVYAYVFQNSSSELEKRTLYVFTDGRLPGVGQRLSVRNTTHVGERVSTAPFSVF